DDGGRIQGLHAGQNVDPRLPGHPLVEHDEVDLVRAEHVERLRAVLGLEAVTGRLEDHPHRRADALLVVHDEDRAPARERGLLGDHGSRDRSITRYSARPPLAGRWMRTRTRSPGLSWASVRYSAGGSATGFLPSSTMTSPRRRPARSPGLPATTSVTRRPPEIPRFSWSAASPVSGSTLSPQLSSSGAPAFDHLGDEDALALAHAESPRELIGHVLDRDAEPPAHHPAGGDQLAHDLSGLVDRDREPDPLTRRHDRGVDADHLPVQVQERPAGVPRIDRRVGLDEVLVRRHADAVARRRRDDPDGHRAIEAEGVADRDRPLADAELVGVAEL